MRKVESTGDREVPWALKFQNKSHIPIQLAHAGKRAITFQQVVWCSLFGIEVSVAFNIAVSLERFQRVTQEFVILVLRAGPAVERVNPNRLAEFFGERFHERLKLIRFSTAVSMNSHEIDPQLSFLGFFHELLMPRHAIFIGGRRGRSQLQIFLRNDRFEFRPRFEGIFDRDVALFRVGGPSFFVYSASNGTFRRAISGCSCAFRPQGRLFQLLFREEQPWF